MDKQARNQILFGFLIFIIGLALFLYLNWGDWSFWKEKLWQNGNIYFFVSGMLVLIIIFITTKPWIDKFLNKFYGKK